jgi:hypothetical protein
MEECVWNNYIITQIRETPITIIIILHCLHATRQPELRCIQRSMQSVVISYGFLLQRTQLYEVKIPLSVSTYWTEICEVFLYV